MRVLHAANELNAGRRKVCLAIGFFDGVHLGQQQIIRQTIADARQHEALATVITFDSHPNTDGAPARMPPQIDTLSRKHRRIESLGTDVLLLIRFDQAFSRQTGEQFIRNLARDFGRVHSVCVGANFVFVHRRSGNVDVLRRLGSELGFTVHGLSAVSLDGQPVSSTRIREAILAGDFDTASQMLGGAYSLTVRSIPTDRPMAGSAIVKVMAATQGFAIALAEKVPRHNSRSSVSSPWGRGGSIPLAARSRAGRFSAGDSASNRRPQR